jgi:hypothetical protein
LVSLAGPFNLRTVASSLTGSYRGCGSKDPLIGRGGSAPMVANVGTVFSGRATDGPVRSWEGVVALNAHGGKIYGALPFYARQFFEITLRRRNIPFNLIL